MSNDKQSSVEWLCERLALKLGVPMAISFYIDHAEEIAEAKAMHKEEMINAINNISEKNIKYANNTIIALTKIKGELFMHDKKQAEQYYNEMFGGNK